ncbi:hypothetical protein KC901_03035, partial [Patescibacteria group bacterium]|nr:hypothetical protein [Patescibacteria group bacterium]
MKKSFTIAFIVVILVGVYTYQPKRVHAVLGVGDVVTDPGNTVVNYGSLGEQIWQQIAETVLKPAVRKIADKVFDKLVQDTLTWANGGQDGGPGFINNWDDFLKGTKYEVISSAFGSASTIANSIGENVGIIGIGDAVQMIINGDLDQGALSLLLSNGNQYVVELPGGQTMGLGDLYQT